jgi:outer membrane protein assembly factor BamB
VEDGVPKTEVIAGLADVLTTPCICEDRIVVAGNSGHLFVVDLEGGLMGRLRLPGQIFSSVVTLEGRMFVGCRDNNLYCVVTNKT